MNQLTINNDFFVVCRFLRKRSEMVRFHPPTWMYHMQRTESYFLLL
jgi:hypothetical protein